MWRVYVLAVTPLSSLIRRSRDWNVRLTAHLIGAVLALPRAVTVLLQREARAVEARQEAHRHVTRQHRCTQNTAGSPSTRYTPA